MKSMPYAPERITVTDAQLAGWTGELAGTDLLLSGRCPACRDSTFVNLALTSTSLEGADRRPTPALLTTSVPCGCTTSHRDRPATVAGGCGRTWEVTASIAADGAVTLAAATDPYLQEAADAFRREQTGELQAVRTAADRWTAGVVALIGLVGLVMPAVGRDAIRGLIPAARAVVGIALLAALAFAALAVLRGYQAAHGRPITRLVDDDEALRDWYVRHRGQAAVAGHRLRQAIRAATATVLALAVAVGSTVFGPVSQATSAPVRVTRPDGSVVCGTLLSSTRDNALRLRRGDDGSVEVLPAADVVRLQPVRSCTSP
ncbi:hypothetical protein KZZ52_26625 [Dactylosporangium sp. AC04546]|uniref:hypothetical protein n=1 Tax=Dactylosporangium sp. AC04546 TaxID=2862460 RepID=UPI001EE0D4D5|nr:hypothetical protein [Dactylosporangium sp. AC04546]WVK88845.1 hypothetical protein KZZ52_26625 [Dactylosporangium sp. AC04546]